VIRDWRKSSYSDVASCLEWRKSSYCGTSSCLELATDEAIHIRDSKDPDGAQLEFTPDSWTSFISGVKAGQFDL
jgi:hypothetical protein